MAGISQDKLLQVIGLAYDTALEGRDWTDTLRLLSEHFDLHSAMLRMVDYSQRQVGFFDNVGYSLPQGYREQFIDIDPYRDIFEEMPVGSMRSADDYLGARDRRQGQFYNEYEQPNGAEYILGALLARSETVTIQTGFHRAKQAGDFDPATRRALGKILPHLVRAVHIRQILAHASGQQMLAQAALDRLRVGVALVDVRGVLAFANHAAEQLAKESRGAISLALRRLDIKDPRDAAQLNRLVADAAATTAGSGLSTGGEMCVRCGNGTFLQLCVTPLSRERLSTEFIAPAACAAVFISRPGGIDLPWRKIACYYELTPAEAKLAARLAKGESLEEAAGQIGVTVHTARTQLKSIFAKTGCKRQSELVAMLLHGVLAMCETGVA